MPRYSRVAAAAMIAFLPIAGAVQAQQASQTPAGQTGQQMRASDYFDRDVYTRDGSEVGEIEDFLIEGDRIVAAVIEIESRLGIGERRVTIPLSQLRPENDRLVVDMTREQLGTLPTYTARE